MQRQELAVPSRHVPNNLFDSVSSWQLSEFGFSLQSGGYLPALILIDSFASELFHSVMKTNSSRLAALWSCCGRRRSFPAHSCPACTSERVSKALSSDGKLDHVRVRRVLLSASLRSPDLHYMYTARLLQVHRDCSQQEYIIGAISPISIDEITGSYSPPGNFCPGSWRDLFMKCEQSKLGTRSRRFRSLRSRS